MHFKGASWHGGAGVTGPPVIPSMARQRKSGVSDEQLGVSNQKLWVQMKKNSVLQWNSRVSDYELCVSEKLGVLDNKSSWGLQWKSGGLHGPWGSPIRGVSECIKFLPGLLSAINFIISYHILPYLILSRPRITWLKDGIELASFSEHEHVTLLKFWYLGKSF